jgi:hypothetical protein
MQTSQPPRTPAPVCSSSPAPSPTSSSTTYAHRRPSAHPRLLS